MNSCIHVYWNTCCRSNRCFKTASYTAACSLIVTDIRANRRIATIVWQLLFVQTLVGGRGYDKRLLALSHFDRDRASLTIQGARLNVKPHRLALFHLQGALQIGQVLLSTQLFWRLLRIQSLVCGGWLEDLRWYQAIKRLLFT